MHPSSCQSFFDNNTFVNFVPYLRRERFRPHKLQAWFLCRAIGEVHTWVHNGLALKPVDHPLALSTRIHSLYVKAGKSRPFMQVFKLDEVNKLPDHTGHNNFLHSVLHRHTASHSTFTPHYRGRIHVYMKCVLEIYILLRYQLCDENDRNLDAFHEWRPKQPCWGNLTQHQSMCSRAYTSYAHKKVFMGVMQWSECAEKLERKRVREIRLWRMFYRESLMML